MVTSVRCSRSFAIDVMIGRILWGIAYFAINIGSTLLQSVHYYHKIHLAHVFNLQRQGYNYCCYQITGLFEL